MEEKNKAIKYKDYPEGSGGKAIFDYYHISPQEYLVKYYSEKDRIDRFKSFYNDYVLPILNKENRVNYNIFLSQKKPPFVVDYEKFDEFFNNKNLYAKYSDDELFNFLSFLYAISYQLENIDNFINWLNNKKYFNNNTLDEILKLSFGSDFIKSNLRELPILGGSWV
jgi:hypothetical protein